MAEESTRILYTLSQIPAVAKIRRKHRGKTRLKEASPPFSTHKRFELLTCTVKFIDKATYLHISLPNPSSTSILDNRSVGTVLKPRGSVLSSL
jgi:hypothetical protein